MKFLVLLFTLFLSFQVQASFWIQDGSITNKKLATINKSESTTISNTWTGSVSTVTVASVSITTSGRPVLLRLMVAGYPGIIPTENFYMTRPSGGGGLADFVITRGATNIYYDQIGSGLTGRLNYSLAGISFIDNPPAGTYTYTLYMTPNATNTQIGIQNAKFVAYEI